MQSFLRNETSWLPRFITYALATLSVTVATAQSPIQGRWADANDPIAKQLIEQERKWAVLECQPSNVVNDALADDFIGTSPDGPLYTRAEALKEPPAVTGSVTGCRLLKARVRFFGDNLAMIYGKETSARKGKDGKTFNRTLIWTDTWLKRNSKWQIIAVQDMRVPGE
jgi:hypothetical protein